MGRQLDRVEQRLDELASLVGSIAWYYEETLDQIAFIDQRLAAIERKLEIETEPRAEPSPRVQGPKARPPPYDSQ